MIATSYSSVRKDLKKYCDKVIDDCETVIITRKDDENVVLMSEEEYNNLMKNLYIMSNRKYYNQLLLEYNITYDYKFVYNRNKN